jgi:hypothetical protein
VFFFFFWQYWDFNLALCCKAGTVSLQLCHQPIFQTLKKLLFAGLSRAHL